MKIRTITLFYLMMILSLSVLKSNASITYLIQDSSEIDTDYSNVDVVVQCEWGSSEKHLGVDVVAINKDNHKNIIIYKDECVKCEISILEGVVVKIFKHNSTSILKIYKG